MNFNKKEDLKSYGFKGFKTVAELWSDKSCIPKSKGIYLVLNHSDDYDFILPGMGGFFKGRDPNITIEKLRNKIVPNSQVVYVGKAGRSSGASTLYSRINQYLRFGQSKKVGHWGGRYIWQLKNHSELIFCWKETPNQEPRDVEKELLNLHIEQFGKIPFANLNT